MGADSLLQYLHLCLLALNLKIGKQYFLLLSCTLSTCLTHLGSAIRKVNNSIYNMLHSPNMFSTIIKLSIVKVTFYLLAFNVSASGVIAFYVFLRQLKKPLPGG